MNTLIDSTFVWFIGATFRGSLLAVAVLVMLAATRTYLSAAWRSTLWLPVLFVLGAPWLPGSRWALDQKIARAVNGVSHFSASYGVWMNLHRPPNLTSAPLIRSEDAGGRSPSGAQSRWSPAFRVAAILWLMGAAGTFGLMLISYSRVLRNIRQSQVPSEPEIDRLIQDGVTACSLKSAPEVLVSTAVQSPAITGFRRPLLLLPHDFTRRFTPDEMSLILRHEFAHIRRGDLFVNWLSCLLRAVHWANPFLRFVFARMRLDRETACDAAVLAGGGLVLRAAYGRVFLKLESALATPAPSLALVGVLHRRAELRARIQAMAKDRPQPLLSTALALALISLLTLGGATKAQDPAPAPAADRALEAPAVAGENRSTVQEFITQRWELSAEGVETFRVHPEQTLRERGVSFPPGAGLELSRDGKFLLVKNNRKNLATIEAYLRGSGALAQHGDENYRSTIIGTKTGANGLPDEIVGRADRIDVVAATGEATLIGWPEVRTGNNVCVALSETTTMVVSKSGQLKISGPHKTIIQDGPLSATEKH